MTFSVEITVRLDYMVIQLLAFCHLQFFLIQEWKERKKYQKRLIAAKKKLCEMEQKHVFHGLRFGEKAERSLLADLIVGVNLKLLQQVLKSVETPSRR